MLVLVGGVVGAAAAAAPWLAGRITYAVVSAQNDADRAQLVELAKHDQLSQLFRAVARTVKPAVVEIRITKKVRMGTGATPDMEEFLKRFFGENELPPGFRQPEPEQRWREFFSHGLGSGTIVDAKEGYILTNYHVVAGADEVEIVLADQRTFETEWIRSDPLSDLAIVKIKPDRLISAPLGDSDKMEVGDWVLAIGAPRGLPQTVTAGIVSAKGRQTGQSRMYENYIQTDAAINRGNSGGPLVNMRGEVIGVNNSIVTYSGGNEGIGFAVPSSMARNIMKQLIEKGKVTRGYLGVRIQNVDPELAKSFGLEDTKGALVTEVFKGSPADKADLKEQDFIVSVDGKKVANVNELRNAIARLEPGKQMRLEVIRDRKPKTLDVTIVAQPEDMATALVPGQPSPKAAQSYGLEVATMTDALARKYGYDETPRGVVITSVQPVSDAAKQGLDAGMVITGVDGKAVTSAGEFARLLAARKANGVRLRVTDPNGGRWFVFITPERQD